MGGSDIANVFESQPDDSKPFGIRCTVCSEAHKAGIIMSNGWTDYTYKGSMRLGVRQILIAASQVECEEARTRILLAAVEESWAQDGEDGHLYIKYRCVSADFIINERMLDLVDATGDRSLQCIVDMRTSLERFSGDVVRERVVPDPPLSAEGTGSEDAEKKGRRSG